MTSGTSKNTTAGFLSALAIAVIAYVATGCGTSPQPSADVAAPATVFLPAAANSVEPTEVQTTPPASTKQEPKVPVQVVRRSMAMKGEWLSRSAISAALTPATNSMASCYDPRLDRTLAVLATFEVNADGSVANIITQVREADEPSLGSCVAKKLAQIAYQPLQDGPVNVKIQYWFSRGTVPTPKRNPRVVLVRSKATPPAAYAHVHFRMLTKVEHFDACYQLARAHDPNLAVTVQIDFSVDATGRPQGISTHMAPHSNSGLPACIRRVLKQTVFMKPQGGHGTVKVAHKYRFNPVGDR